MPCVRRDAPIAPMASPDPSAVLLLEDHAMKPREIALLAGTLACMCAALAFGQSAKNWIDIKSPTELRALYSNKTFKGENWVAYLKSDGTGLLVTQDNQRIPRTWVVKGDEVCVTDRSGTNCFQFMRNPANPRQFIGRQVVEGWAFWFSVEDGVPTF
jgi:hypothetical protein